MGRVFTHLQRLKDGCLHALTSRFARWTKPLVTSLPLPTLTDLGRSKSELLAENALLRQQLNILKRQDRTQSCAEAARPWKAKWKANGCWSARKCAILETENSRD